MSTTKLDSATLKIALKEALAETLQEQRALFHEVFAEVLEDFAPGRNRAGVRTLTGSG